MCHQMSSVTKVSPSYKLSHPFSLMLVNAVSTVFLNTDLTNTPDQGRSTLATFVTFKLILLLSRFLYRFFARRSGKIQLVPSGKPCFDLS